MLPEGRNIPTVNNLIGPVARGSVLHKQLQGFQMASTNPVTSCAPICYQSPNPAMNKRGNESGHVPTQTNSNATDDHLTMQPLRKFYWQSPQVYTHWTSVSATVPPAKVLLIFLYYPTNVVRKLLTWIYFPMNKVRVSLQAGQELYTKTTAQANNNVWYGERKHRITASKFGKILKICTTPSPVWLSFPCGSSH